MLGLLSPAASLAAEPIQICAEQGDYPPFFYFRRSGSPSEPVGVTVELLRRILGPAGIAYRVVEYPWSRCLKSVTEGESAMAIDVYFDPKRAAVLSYSRPYVALTPQIFYSRRAHPDGLAVTGLQDLRKLRGCGILGYSYAHYGLAEGDIDQAASDHGRVIAMVEGGHCDYFPEEYEVMAGYRLTRQPYLDDPDLARMSVPGAVAPQLHFVLTRSAPLTAKLLAVIDPAIDRMTGAGEIAAMLRNQLDATE